MKNHETKTVRFADTAISPKKRVSSRLLNYEKIRVVGKGAFGTAVLYNRKRDNRKVIIKQVNMLTLSASERQMALNEARVLSTLNHENIIKYYDSFEEEGALHIEMEYADAGNLEEYLSKLNNQMNEMVVLNYFKQIVAAIEHMHEHHILHRDLKTANIFMTQEGAIKVGDFGISKMTSTGRKDASTIVGTPYYISPEMCEGKLYDEKSDIWALGCILYEMICLHRTFEATNFPALVQKITKGQFAPIGEHYSEDFRQFVQELLQQEPVLRPTAKEILKIKIPPLIKQCQSDVVTNATPSSQSHRTRSVLYSVKFYEDNLDLLPLETPSRLCIQQEELLEFLRLNEVAASSTHVLAITSEMQVFSWGDNSKGQLGLDTASADYVSNPTCVNNIRENTVIRVGAGDGFSIFVCSNGLVMSCGDGTKGCLGHGDWNDTSKPRIIEKLLSVDVKAVSCGSSHVVVISNEKWAFSWGCGLHGRLGHGKEENICTPMELDFSEDLKNIRSVRCSVDGTVFLTFDGHAWACGNNANNKLGLDAIASSIFTWTKTKTKQALLPTRIKQVSRQILDVSMGSNHSAFLLDNGQVVTCGLNANGQLGRGHRETQEQSIAKVVSSMKTPVTMVLCCDTYTLAGTIDNALYVWGTRKVTSLPKTDVTNDYENTSHEQLTKDENRQNRAEVQINIESLLPQEILVLFSSANQVKRGDIVTMAGLINHGSNVFLMVNTTITVPHRSECSQLRMVKSEPTSASSGMQVNDNVIDCQPIPEWIKKELAIDSR